MKTKNLILVAAFCSFSSQIPSAPALGTAFTYQGRLNANGGAANGVYDFRFRLAVDALHVVGDAAASSALDVAPEPGSRPQNEGVVAAFTDKTDARRDVGVHARQQSNRDKPLPSLETSKMTIVEISQGVLQFAARVQ